MNFSYTGALYCQLICSSPGQSTGRVSALPPASVLAAGAAAALAAASALAKCLRSIPGHDPQIRVTDLGSLCLSFILKFKGLMVPRLFSQF